MLLVLSHGQASVEKGFSVNKQIEVKNLAEESCIVKQIICDYVSYVSGIANVYVTTSSCSCLQHQLDKSIWTYLEEQMKKKITDTNDKRKLLTDKVEQLKMNTATK